VTNPLARLQTARNTRLEAPARPEPTSAREEPTAAAPEALPEAAAPVAPARFNVEVLAALVEQRGAEFPERLEEWRWYVLSLRDVAATSGTLPATVDNLVQDVFEPLLAGAGS
jgi:hypothetical protein